MRNMRKSERAGIIYCQRCLAANAFGLDFCTRCGTRLMLTVEPTALRFDEETAVANYDEHLLERVSALENRLERIAEKVERGIEALNSQARKSYYDHALLETLVNVLIETRVVSERRVDRLLNERFKRDATLQAAASKREEIIARADAELSGRTRSAFERVVVEGFALLERGVEKRGLSLLEKASALSPDNFALNFFIGESFFRAGKHERARDYLERAHAKEPFDSRACLLLGLVCGEEGDSEKAKGLLIESLRGGSTSFAAHYALGRLHSAEANWVGALAEFKEALIARDCPETRYALAYVNFQLGRYRIALRHANKAVALDASYGDALYLLGILQMRLGEPGLANKSFRAAQAAEVNLPRPFGAARRIKKAEEMPSPNFFRRRRGARPLLLTGGDKRIQAALQEDALNPDTRN